MIFGDLLNEARRYAPAITIDRLFPYRFRHILKTFSFVICIVGILPVLLSYVASIFSPNASFLMFIESAWAPLFAYKEYLLGGGLVAFGVWLVLLSLDGFYFSILFTDESSVLREFPKPPVFGKITMDVAEILLAVKPKDATGSFLLSSSGRYVFRRLGISQEAIVSYLKNPERKMIPVDSLLFPDDCIIDIEQYGKVILSADGTFRRFLRSQVVSDKEYEATLRFTSGVAIRIRKRRRWWSRDYLGRTPSIGTSFTYGRAYSLEKFGDYIVHTSVYRANAPLLAYFRKEAEDLERILVRAQGANAVIVGEDADAPLLVAVALARLIERGEAFPPLEHKRLFLMDPELIVSAGGAKALIEGAIQNVFSEAARAGNLVVVIPSVGAFMKSLSQFGIDLFSLIEQYLRLRDTHVIVLSDSDAYHRTFERDGGLMEHFERIFITDKGEQSLMVALERIVETMERREGVFFTHQALTAAVKAATELFSEGAPLDKAVDLLTEVCVSKRGRTVTKGDVERLIESKTGVPLGKPGVGEREKLLFLEDVLKKRVVGQPDAIVAVAAALRRARSGIRSEKKPMGTFLFLGPTGVGKTETVKALAEAYFGSEEAMVRFDMSEFSGSNALVRLIGDGGEEPGLLVAKLREKPFSVFLFDEFEKSSVAVRDLFLQLLDEGFVTDGRGKRAYARSAFLIATSNAASEEIFRLTEEGKDVSGERQVIIETIVEKGLFRPELLNRFDGVILFHPMNTELIEAVARQLLTRFAKRIEEKGYTMVINDALVKYVASQGADPKFGARPLNRAIADKIEQVIADKIIAGSLKPGAKIEFVAADLR